MSATFEFLRETLPLPAGIVQAAVESPAADPAATWLEHVPFEIPRGCDERRRDYALSRLCIREAMGSIEWPADYCGSITHCKGQWAWTAMGPKQKFRAIGIDTESLERTWDKPETVLAIQNKFLAEDEKSRLNASGLDWRVLFSAKESLFKAMSSGFNLQPAFKKFHWTGTTPEHLYFDFESDTFKVLYRKSGSWVHTAAVVSNERVS